MFEWLFGRSVGRLVSWLPFGSVVNATPTPNQAEQKQHHAVDALVRGGLLEVLREHFWVRIRPVLIVNQPLLSLASKPVERLAGWLVEACVCVCVCVCARGCWSCGQPASQPELGRRPAMSRATSVLVGRSFVRSFVRSVDYCGTDNRQAEVGEGIKFQI